MVYVLYALVITIIVAALGCVVPFVQYFLAKRKAVKNAETNKVSKIVFSRDLFDANFNPLFNKVAFASRSFLGARGWIRGPYGKVMTDDDFKQKRNNEYKNDLP